VASRDRNVAVHAAGDGPRLSFKPRLKLPSPREILRGIDVFGPERRTRAVLLRPCRGSHADERGPRAGRCAEPLSSRRPFVRSALATRSTRKPSKRGPVPSVLRRDNSTSCSSTTPRMRTGARVVRRVGETVSVRAPGRAGRPGRRGAVRQVRVPDAACNPQVVGGRDYTRPAA